MVMKKWFVLLLCIFIVTGCSEKENTPTLQSDSNFYKIAMPYKENVGGYSLRSFDKENVANMLSKISKKYFKVNNSLYEEGQYLSSSEIKELLSKENLNAVEEHFKKELEPTFITTIYEQNYLATNGTLKGISLALVLDPQQTYNKEGITYTKTFDSNEVLEWGKQQAAKVIDYLKAKEEFKNVKMIVGLYLANHSALSGNFIYVGEVGKNISWEHVDYQYRWMDSNVVMEQDIQNYNSVLALKSSLNDYSNLSFTAYGLYKQTALQELNITIRSNHLSASTIWSIESILQENLTAFGEAIPIHISFKINDKLKGYSEKKENSLELETYILEG